MIGVVEPFVTTSPMLAAAIVGLPVAGKTIVATLALRGAESKDRAGIVKAVSGLFRWRRQ